MAERFHRILIVADESADWIVAGLRQLDRLSLAVDEFALENNETAPVLICIEWRPEMDELQRWIPANERLTMVDFTAKRDGNPYDLLLNTRLFLYRNAIGKLIKEQLASEAQMTSGSWEQNFQRVAALPRFQKGAWEYITNGDQIDAIERRFLRESGKSQDGLVSRYLNRPLSRTVTRLLLRFPTTPNGWTWLIFPIAIIATLILLRGTYWSFVWGVLFFHVFSVLDGCDGEIARAKFLESERGRKLDSFFDVLSNILLVLGLGFGLFEQAKVSGSVGWLYAVEGMIAGGLIALNEFYLAKGAVDSAEQENSDLATFDESLYPRHRRMVQKSGLLRLGGPITYWIFQLTKRDVAILFFVVLAVFGIPAMILHLLFAVGAISSALAWRSR